MSEELARDMAAVAEISFGCLSAVFVGAASGTAGYFAATRGLDFSTLPAIATSVVIGLVTAYGTARAVIKSPQTPSP